MPERQPFPVWLRELCYVCGMAISLTAFVFAIKSDQRSTREELTNFIAITGQKITDLSSDISAIRASIPNKDLYDLKLKGLDDKIEEVRGDMKYEAAKNQKLREGLIKKGWVD